MYCVKKEEKSTELIKEGIQTEQHDCTYMETGFLSREDQGNKYVSTYNRICTICGKAEKVILTEYKQTYEDVFEQFHGKVADNNR